MSGKGELRRLIRRRKAEHTETQLARWSEGISRLLKKNRHLVEAETVLMYWALPDEVRLYDLADELLGQGRTVLLPRVVSDTEMTLHRYEGRGMMEEGAFGILEPVNEPVPTELLGGGSGVVALIPGMAFDRQGHRLGRGKGYYDRLLAQCPYIYKVGVCFPFQMLDSVPAEEHDVVMEEVVCFFSS